MPRKRSQTSRRQQRSKGVAREPMRRWKSSSISRSSRGASRHRSGGTSSRRSGRSIRCCVPMTSMTSMTSQFQHEMRPVSLINDAQIIERILRHVGSVGVSQWVDEIRNHGGPVLGETRTPLDRSPIGRPRSVDLIQRVSDFASFHSRCRFLSSMSRSSAS